MTGLELSRKYYEECGKPMLESEFSDVLPLLAIGFVGSGSDRFGFDDEISRDHDFEPGFCIFIPGEDKIDSRMEFKLERAYAKLPKEFMGFTRQMMSPVGGNRNGVIRTAEFYKKLVGSEDGNISELGWMFIPDYSLAEATNGEVFYDGLGEFTEIRNRLMNMPEDVRLKRIAGNVLLMAQAGQYNFSRCVKRGEFEAAALSCFEFVKAAVKVEFLLQKKYAPYYKWQFKALRMLDGGSAFAEKLSALICSKETCEKGFTNEDKYYMIESVAADIIDQLQSQGITKATCGDLEKHAYSVNDFIKDNNIRNSHIMAAI